MSPEEPEFSSYHINLGVGRKSIDNSSTIDYAASMGTAIDSIVGEEVGKSMNVETKKMKKKKKKVFRFPQ